MQIPDDLQMDPPTSECRDGPGLLLNWLCWLWRCLCARARSLAHGLSLFRVFLITPLCNNNPPLASTKMNKCSNPEEKNARNPLLLLYIRSYIRSYQDPIRYQILARRWPVWSAGPSSVVRRRGGPANRGKFVRRSTAFRCSRVGSYWWLGPKCREWQIQVSECTDLDQ
jgi:hypothetical protein